METNQEKYLEPNREEPLETNGEQPVETMHKRLSINSKSRFGTSNRDIRTMPFFLVALRREAARGAAQVEEAEPLARQHRRETADPNGRQPHGTPYASRKIYGLDLQTSIIAIVSPNKMVYKVVRTILKFAGEQKWVA